MKKIQSAFALLLTMVMCVGMTIPVFAADEPVIVPAIHNEKVLGTSADMEFSGADLSINPHICPSTESVARSNSLLFTMTVNFQNLVGSNASDRSKYFTNTDITKGSLKISGTLGSTNSACKEVEVGYAIYNAATDTYTSMAYAFFDNYIYSAAYFTWFDSNTKYYGYAKKVNPGNYYIKGDLNFWNSDEY